MTSLPASLNNQVTGANRNVQFDVSVIIPTHNRADYLASLLTSLASEVSDSVSAEIIIVDNNSSDNTRSMVDEMVRWHSQLNIQYIFESLQGAALARNRAMDNSHGNILLFLDDDTRVFSGWLDAIITSFSDPSVGCVGGPAILDFQGRDIPLWLRGDLKGLLSGYELDYSQPKEITKVADYPFLCNMAIRRIVINQVGMFRPDLGRSGDRKLAGEETELIARIIKAGWKVLYVPDAKVWHLVTPERLDKGYIYRIGVGLAATHVYMTSDRYLRTQVRWFCSDLWYTVRMLFRLILSLAGRRSLWFDDFMRFWMVAKRIPIRLKMWFLGNNALTG